MPATIELQTTPAPLLAELVKAATAGGEITLTDGGHIVARIVPVHDLPRIRRKRQFGSAKDRITVPDDFDAPLDVFKDYM